MICIEYFARLAPEPVAQKRGSCKRDNLYKCADYQCLSSFWRVNKIIIIVKR